MMAVQVPQSRRPSDSAFISNESMKVPALILMELRGNDVVLDGTGMAGLKLDQSIVWLNGTMRIGQEEA